MNVNSTLKKYLCSLLLLSMIVGSFSISATGAAAAAKTLEANQEVSGTIFTHERIVYNFVMPKKGYFSFRLSNSKSFLSVSMKVNNKTYEEEVYLSSGELFTSSSYAFKPGTRIEITLDNSYTMMDYTLCVDVKQKKNFESENNNTRKKADPIKSGKTYTGLIMQDDKDWYVFKAPKTGNYKISAVNTTDGQVDFSTYNGSKKIDSGYLHEGKGYQKCFSGKLKKGQKVYVAISYSSLYSTKGVFYKIRAKRK